MQLLHYGNGEAPEISRPNTYGTPSIYVLPQGDPGLYSDEAELNIWREYLEILRRNKMSVTIALFVGALISFIFSLLQFPVYRVFTSVEIQGFQEPFTNVPTEGATSPFIQTQVQLLESQSFGRRVHDRMVRMERARIESARDYLSGVRSALGLPSGSPTIQLEEALSMAQRSLKVLVTQDSRILKIQCDSIHPQIAAEFANTAAREYIQQNMEERWDAYRNTGEWLTQAKDQLRAKLEKAEKDLLRYAQSANLPMLFTSESENVSELKLKQLQQQLSTAQVERIAKQSVYEASMSGNSESLPEVLDNGPMASYQIKLADLKRQMAELSSSLTPEHYKIKRLQAEISALESEKERERTNIIRRIRIEYESALRREKQLAARYDEQASLVSAQAEKLITYKMLKREVDTNRQLYELALQRGKEASIASAMRTSNIKVIDRAGPPKDPYKPDLPINLSLGSVGGLLFGLLFVFARERFNSNVKVPGSLLRYLDVRELGVIPSARVDPDARPLLAGHGPLFLRGSSNPIKAGNGTLVSRERTGQNGSTVADRENLALVTWTLSPSLMAEAFKATMASILFSGKSSERPRVILLTSPLPREGKSTITSNLGIALSEINHRVLLVDGDMRRPQLHRIFDVANSWGFSDLLQERTPIAEYTREALARQTRIPGFYLLPSGPARANISTLLYSVRATELMNRLRDEFDTVLVDTPPVLSVPDARILSRLADGVIVIVRANQTTRDAALAALKRFEEDGTNVLGTILNDWDPKNGSGHYGAGYPQHYYYSKSAR